MPNSQDYDSGVGDFIPHLISSDDDAPDLARRVDIQSLANTGILDKSLCGMDKLLNNAHSRIRCNRLEKGMKSGEIC